jgi:type IV pilus assembly protein PilA
MKNHYTSSSKGFTLLEILLVIAAIGILAAIVLVAINPNRQLAQARNAQRRSDVQTILNAVYQKIIDEGANGSTATLNAISTTAAEIYKSGTTSGTTSCAATQIDMAAIASDAGADIVPTYLASIPQDPSEPSTSNCSGFLISKDGNNRITVTADNTELVTPDFSVTR